MALDPEHAYRIVDVFLEDLWEALGRPDELGLFSSMCSYIPGRGTADPAMWFDWLAWARQVQTGDLVPENTGRRGALTPTDVGPLTPEQAYQAMFKFIEE